MTYEELIKLRQEGHSQQSIGNLLGITKQAVSLRLKKCNFHSKASVFWGREAARLADCHQQYLERCRLEGLVNPRKVGVHWVYTPKDVDTIILLLQRNCPYCGDTFRHFGRAKYCPKCRAEKHRYPYPFLDREAKKRVYQRLKIWQANNLKKVREIR